MSRGFPDPAKRSSTVYETLADEELLRLIRVGDPAAFELVYDRHCDAAFLLAHCICGRRASAEDVLHDAFLALWRYAAQYDATRGSVRSWVLRLVHRRAQGNENIDAPRCAVDGLSTTVARLNAPRRAKRALMAAVRTEVERVQVGSVRRGSRARPSAVCERRLRSWSHWRWGY